MKNQAINFIREKLTSKYRPYYSFILLLFLLCPYIHGQITDNWTEIRLVDTLEYTLFGTEHIPDIQYPPDQLFDADFSTCWVSHMRNGSTYPSVFVALPKNLTKDIILSVFSGYGKSKSLFLKNARPEKIQISLHTALVPDGYVSEHGLLCKVYQSPFQETVVLKDTFGIQNINLQNVYEQFKPYHFDVLAKYKSHFDFPLLDTLVLVKIGISSTYPGTYYKDICLSEIFFNDCYISAIGKASNRRVDSIYINEAENTLLVDTDEQMAVAVYHEQESILQIADYTPDNKFAVLIMVPLEIAGRVETQYRIVDLLNKEEISGMIDTLIPDYKAGEPVYLEQKDGKNFVVFPQSERINRIELRSLNMQRN